MIDKITQYILEIKTPSIVYHGSNNLYKTLQPKPNDNIYIKHGLFASIYKKQAALYMLTKFYKRTDVSVFGSLKRGKWIWEFTELHTNAFKLITHNKPGYMYELSGETFTGPVYGAPGDISIGERVSHESLKPLKVTKINNIINYLKSNGSIFIKYNKRNKIKGIK